MEPAQCTPPLNRTSELGAAGMSMQQGNRIEIDHFAVQQNAFTSFTLYLNSHSYSLLCLKCNTELSVIIFSFKRS